MLKPEQHKDAYLVCFDLNRRKQARISQETKRGGRTKKRRKMTMKTTRMRAGLGDDKETDVSLHALQWIQFFFYYFYPAYKETVFLFALSLDLN